MSMMLPVCNKSDRWVAGTIWQWCLFFVLIIFTGGAQAAFQSTWLALTVNDTAVSNGQYAYQWEHRNTAVLNRANSVGIDSSGNIYSAGYNDEDTAVRANIVVTGHDAAGNIIWEATAQDCPGLATTNCNDRAIAMVVDTATDQLYVLAASDGGAGTDQDLVVLKYDPAVGTVPVWVSDRYDNASSEDIPIALGLSPAGGVYAIGYSTAAGAIAKDVVTLLINASGVLTWSKLYDSQTGIDDRPVDMMVDASSNVYVLANSKGSGVITTPVILKYDSAGNPIGQSPSSPVLYQYSNSHSTNASAYAMTTSSAGDIYLTGWVFTAGDRDVLVVAVDAVSGAQLTEGSFNSTQGHDMGSAITTDSGGSIYVGALAGGVSDYDIFVIKFDSNLDVVALGAYQNSGTDDGPGPGWIDSEDDRPGPDTIYIDSGGQVYLSAAVGNLGAHNFALYVFDSSLTLVGSTIKTFAGDDLLRSTAFATDANGNTIALMAGHSWREDTGDDDYLLVKFGEMNADLSVGSVTAVSTWPYGNVLTLQSQVSNVKDATVGSLADASAFTVQYSLVPTVGSPVGLIGSSVGGLASGASTTDSVDYTLVTDSIPVGNYTLRAEVDSLAQVQETDETNNIADGVSISIIDPPDLIVTAVSALSSVSAGAALLVDYTVQNQRAIDAASPFDMAFSLSLDSVIGNGDDIALTGTDTIASLAGGASVNNQVSVTVPNTVPAGAYRLIAVVDSGGAIIEASETNNSFINTTSTVTVLAIADLTVSAVSGPLGAVMGDTIAVANTVSAAASGGDAVGAFVVGFYLSTDATITAADTRLGERTIASGLVAGLTDATPVNVTIPTSGLTEGIYYLGAIVDDTGVVVESYETNNATPAAVTISVGLAAGTTPDLRVSALSGPTSAARGSVISVTPTVQNVLPVSIAVPFKVGIYLSTDGTITTGDRRLGESTIASLAGNAVDATAVNVTIPFQVTSSITWTNVVRATVSGTTLTANVGAGNAASGASSVETFSTDGAVEFTVGETNLRKAFGLSANDPDADYLSIDYAIFCQSNSTLQVYENGIQVFFSNPTYAVNDVLRVERNGSVITYLKNGTVFYTSAVPSSGTLLADVALRQEGATINNAQIISVDVASGTYFLGAIADDTDQVTELSETNNAAVQTDGSGTAQSTLLSLSAVGSSRSGSGAISISGLICLFLVTLLVTTIRIRRHQAQN